MEESVNAVDGAAADGEAGAGDACEEADAVADVAGTGVPMEGDAKTVEGDAEDGADAKANDDVEEHANAVDGAAVDGKAEGGSAEIGGVVAGC